MNIFVLLFDEMTVLDAIGPYDVLRQVPGWEVSFVGKERGEVRSEDRGLGLLADFALAEKPEADVLLVPGGAGTRILCEDDEVLDWVRGVDAGSRWTTSVCTGSSVLAAAGLLRDRKASGHWVYLDELREHGVDPIGGRWVEDGKYITAAGVSAGIDMALHFVARELGPEVAQAVQLGIEYDPQPPFETGSPDKAPAALVDAVRAYELG